MNNKTKKRIKKRIYQEMKEEISKSVCSSLKNEKIKYLKFNLYKFK